MPRRRDYVSFFREGRRRRTEFAAFDRRRRPSLLLLPALALAVLGVAVWWYAFRQQAGDMDEVITLEDVNVPAVLLPADEGGVPPEDEATVRCIEVAVDWSTFQGTPARTGCTEAPLITTPLILWERDVGVQGWLNNTIVAENMVFVGSAGLAQGERDRADGIYAFDLETGEQLWFFGAELDVNGIGFADNTVIGTGDEGRVWALAMANGAPLWTDDLEAPTFGNPLTVGGIVVIGDQAGRVTAYNVRGDGSRLWQVQLNGPIRGGAASDGEMIVVNSENREVVAVDLRGAELWRVTVRTREPRSELTRLWAAPTIVGDLIVLGLLRDDTHIEPALVALDKSDGSIVWEATDAAAIAGDWANVRSSPAAIEGTIVYGQTYSSLLVAVDVATGNTLWAADLTARPEEPGVHCLQAWPSPAVVGDQAIVPRQDGGLYAVSLATQRVVWSIYLGTGESSGQFPDDFGPGFCDPLPEGFSAILASPAVAANGTIVIGTYDGRLVAIVDRDW